MLCQVVAMPTEAIYFVARWAVSKARHFVLRSSDVQAFELNLQFALLFLAGFN